MQAVNSMNQRNTHPTSWLKQPSRTALTNRLHVVVQRAWCVLRWQVTTLQRADGERAAFTNTVAASRVLSQWLVSKEAAMGYLPYSYFSGPYLEHWVDVGMKMPHSKLHEFETYIYNKNWNFQVFLRLWAWKPFHTGRSLCPWLTSVK